MTKPAAQRALYRELLRIRRVEERIAELYSEQEMRCPVHLSIGQEAVAVGVSAQLERGDLVVSGHRAHAHYLAKGGDLRAFLAELYGKATGCCGGKGGSMHLVDLDAGFLGATPVVGSTIAVGVGSAFAAWQRGMTRVTVIYLGEAATEEGVFHESINFAALYKLPVVFVCENNLYSVYSPLSVRQPAGRRVYEQAASYGVDAQEGDGNDLEAVSRLASIAVATARNGKGPVFLEFATYRWREHCGPNYDNELGYRTLAEFQEWRSRDPVRCYERQLLAAGVINDADLAALDAEITEEVDDAFRFAKESPFPDSNELVTDVYRDRSKAHV